MAHAPREICEACRRPLPRVAPDSPVAKRSRFSVAEPRGEEGTLEDLAIQLVERYGDAWPEDLAEQRRGVGLVQVGAPGWRYRALHFAMYAALTLNIEPSEEGS